MKRWVWALALPVMATGGIAVAQDLTGFGIEAGVSTLGAFVAPTYEINDKLSLRAPLYFGAMSDEFDVDGNTVEGSIDANAIALMADFHPLGNALRVSGGIGIGGYDLSGKTTDLTLDGTTFAGVSEVTIGQKQDLAPVLSVGFNHEFASGLTLFGDIGGRIATYQVSVKTAAPLTPADQADLDASIAGYNDDLAAFGVTPFLAFGIGFRF